MNDIPTLGTVITFSTGTCACQCCESRLSGTIRRSQMKAQSLDILFAFKVVALSSDLTSQEKRIAATIFDHFNRKTGQCDPSLNGIAALLGVHRRTVLRAVAKLVKLKFLERLRHGGNFHRNLYIPDWQYLRSLEAGWMKRRQAQSERWRRKLSPLQGQNNDVGGDSSAPQTNHTNQSYETFAEDVQAHTSPAQRKTPTSKRLGKIRNDISSTMIANAFNGKQISSAEAALDSAERRWCIDLQSRFGHDAVVAGQIAEAIDEALKLEITHFEMKYPGKGLDLLLERLRRRKT